MATTRHDAGPSRRWLRVIRWAFFGLVGLTLLLLAFALVPVIPDPTLHYTDRKGQLVKVQQTAQWQEQDSIYTELSLVSSSGLRVELTTRLPYHQPRHVPWCYCLAGAAPVAMPSS